MKCVIQTTILCLSLNKIIAFSKILFRIFLHSFLIHILSKFYFSQDKKTEKRNELKHYVRLFVPEVKFTKIKLNLTLVSWSEKSPQPVFKLSQVLYFFFFSIRKYKKSLWIFTCSFCIL